jgi:hypothetical protein
MVNGKLFITKGKAYSLNPAQFDKHVRMVNKINYPGIGEMVEYSGEYSRK